MVTNQKEITEAELLSAHELVDGGEVQKSYHSPLFSLQYQVPDPLGMPTAAYIPG